MNCLNLPPKGRAPDFNVFLEFGQPLKSVEDARDYISTFRGAETLEDTLSTLINTGNADYPFYLPYQEFRIDYQAVRMACHDGLLISDGLGEQIPPLRYFYY